jgi:Tfp pilus assembly protein PilO
VRLLWVFAVSAFAVGSYYLETRFERAIHASQTSIETLYRSTLQNQRVVARADVLRQAQHNAEAELRGVSGERSLTAVTAALLVTLQNAAQRCRVDVLALQPGSTVAEDRLAATELTMRMHGRFTNLIAFLQDISRHAEMISVSRTDLALSAGNASDRQPQLDATIHATLYRLQDSNAFGGAGVATAR